MCNCIVFSGVIATVNTVFTHGNVRLLRSGITAVWTSNCHTMLGAVTECRDGGKGRPYALKSLKD